MKQMEVTILGQSYLLGCPEGGEAALTKAVSQVDKEMCAIRDAGRIKARERIAVLAALNLAYQLVGAAPAAAHASAQTGQSTSPESTPGAASDGATSETLSQLIRRLDDALAQDGQLL